MKKYSLLILLALLYFNIVKSISNPKVDPPIRQINIKVRSNYVYKSFCAFNVDVYCWNDSIKVVYSVMDSIKANEVWNGYHATHIYPVNVDSMAVANNWYLKDSIVTTRNESVVAAKTIDSCFMNDETLFESKLAPDQVVVGGSSYKLSFKQNEGVWKTISATSPTRSRYPFVNRLIHVIFKLYPKENGILNKKNTNSRFS